LIYLTIPNPQTGSAQVLDHTVSHADRHATTPAIQQSRSTINLTLPLVLLPAAGSVWQTVQFDLTTIPKVPPPISL
jgi:hypothetical protein